MNLRYETKSLGLIVAVLALASCNSSTTAADVESELTDIQSVVVESVPDVTINKTDSLTIYYPNFSRIDLVTGVMPCRKH